MINTCINDWSRLIRQWRHIFVHLKCYIWYFMTFILNLSWTTYQSLPYSILTRIIGGQWRHEFAIYRYKPYKLTAHTYIYGYFVTSLTAYFSREINVIEEVLAVRLVKVTQHFIYNVLQWTESARICTFLQALLLISYSSVTCDKYITTLVNMPLNLYHI